jgi:DNA-binding MarR family transcriptional regulator
MGANRDSNDDIALPVLIGATQRTYATAIQTALAEAGCGDMPRTAHRVVGNLARGGSSVQYLACRLAISKQAASRLVDTFVEQCYWRRAPDPADRRRIRLVLADRGRSAAREIQGAIRAVDGLLARQFDGNDIATTRAALHALVAVGREERSGRSNARQSRTS